MKKLFTILLISCVGVLNAQGLRKKLADDYFNVLAFESAAPIYKDLSTQTIKGKNQNWEVVRRAALSYYLSQNYAESAKMYEALFKAGYCNNEDDHNYAEVLRVLGKYEEANAIMQVILVTDSENKWAKEYILDKTYFTDLKLDSNNYTIKKMPFSKGYGDFAPMVYGDKILFTSYRHNQAFVNRSFGWDQTFFLNTYVSTPNKKGEYTSAKMVKLGAAKNRVPHDGPYAISEATNTAMVTMNIPGTYGKKEVVRLGLFTTTVDAKSFPKTGKDLKPFEFNNVEYNVAHACFTADGNTLYFSSDKPGGFGKSDIYRSTWVNGAWSNPENLGAKINTAFDDMFPFISHDGDLFFASKGHVGLGGFDIFMARHNHTTGIFDEPENLGYPLNTRFDDFSISTNKEGNIAYFASNRGDYYDRIYQTNMYVPQFIMNGLVTENNTEKTPLPNTKVTIKNLTTGTEEEVITDSLGKFTYTLKKNTKYSVITNKEDYEQEGEYSVSTVGKLKSEDFDANMQMKSLKVAVNLLIVDKETKKPLSGAKVKLKSAGVTTEYETDKDGYVHIISDRKKDYAVSTHYHSHKDGEGNFNTRVGKDVDKLDLTYEMEMIKKGDVFVINNIYFDYNKATLRIESTEELEKLAAFLLENSNIKVELSAHTDSRGSANANKSLSQKRAQSCVDYLIKKGVLKDNLLAKGYGEEKLVNGCKDGVDCTEEEHQANRRVEIKVLSVR